MTNTYQEIEACLRPYMRVMSGKTSSVPSLDVSLGLTRHVGSPHERLRVVHVAGTSGKTSTCYYLAQLLSSSGATVGLTVSPHVRHIGERVQVNGEPLGERKMCDLFDEFIALVEKFEVRPSYFEVAVVFALWVFDRLGLDYAVVETGLGGTYDTTNICRRRDKFCVITDIGYDHTELLGNSLQEVAGQKAGIIAEQNHVLVYQQSEEIMNTIMHSARECRATVEVLGEGYAADEDFLRRNLWLAKAAYGYIARRDGLSTVTEQRLVAALELSVPGRMNVRVQGDSTVIYDGAHNSQKMHALVGTLRRRYPGARFVVVLAMKQGKDHLRPIEELAPIARRIVTTEFRSFQDAPIRAESAATLLAACKERGIETSQSESPEVAVDSAVEDGEPYVLVTGSLYVLGELLG